MDPQSQPGDGVAEWLFFPCNMFDHLKAGLLTHEMFKDSIGNEWHLKLLGKWVMLVFASIDMREAPVVLQQIVDLDDDSDLDDDCGPAPVLKTAGAAWLDDPGLMVIAAENLRQKDLQDASFDIMNVMFSGVLPVDLCE